MNPVSHQTFSLARVLANLRLIDTYTHDLIKDPATGPKSKDALRMIKKRATASLNDFSMMLSPASLAVMRSELLDDEVSLQHENISNMILAMPKGIRDQIEAHVIGLYNVYSLNK